MDIQEIIVIVCAAFAVVFSIRTFIRQFAENNGACSSCSCEPAAQKAAERNRNAVRYKKRDLSS